MSSDAPTLRADAQRNRGLILSAAEAVFLEQGGNVALEDVAKRAGVGIGTLYRRFPTREALLAATCSERFVLLAEASRARAAKLDAGSAVRAYLEDLVTNTSIYRSLAASLGTVLQHGTPGCNAINDEGKRLLRSAQDTGAIRQDVSFDDLVYVAIAIAFSVEQGSAPPSRITHLVGLFFDGISVR